MCLGTFVGAPGLSKATHGAQLMSPLRGLTDMPRGIPRGLASSGIDGLLDQAGAHFY